jgi:hypothetical protein
MADIVSSADLSNLEDHLIAISDDIGSLNEKLYELRESISKLRTRTIVGKARSNARTIRTTGSMDHVDSLTAMKVGLSP